MAGGKSILEGLYSCFNSGRLQDAERYLAADVVVTDSGGVTLRGPAQVLAYLGGWRAAFPDGRMSITRRVESGDLVAAEVRGEGTHGGPLTGPQGILPATGKQIVLNTVDFCRIEKNQIVQWNSYFDSADLMAQLGVVSAPAAAPSRAREVALAVIQAYNEGRFADLERCVAVDCAYTTNDDVRLEGPAAIRAYYEAWHSAFPDSQLVVDDMMVGGDVVFLRSLANGTQTGPLAGPQGTLPITGKHVANVAVRDIMEVKDGKVCKWDSTYDQAKFMRQMGLAPTPGAPSPRAAYERLIAAFNSGNAVDFAACLAPNCQLTETGGVSMKGPAAITEVYMAWRTAFPTATITLENTVESGDCCAGFGSATGMHTGPLGELPATGRALTVAVQDFVRVSDGQITEWKSFYDRASMLSQLGILREGGSESRNLEAVQRGYAGFVSGDVAKLMAELTEDVDWSVEAAPGSTVPWHMSVHRREDVPKFFRAISAAVETTKFEVVELVATGNQVVARVRFEGTVRKNGRKTGGEACHWFTFNDAGKVARWHSYENTAADVEAWFALSPTDYSQHLHH